MSNEEIIKKYIGSYPDVHSRKEWNTWDEIRESMNRDLNIVRIDTIKQCAERAQVIADTFGYYNLDKQSILSLIDEIK